MTTFHTQLPQHDSADTKDDAGGGIVGTGKSAESKEPGAGTQDKHQDGLAETEQAKVAGEHERIGSHGGDGNYDDRDIFADTDVRESGKFELRPDAGTTDGSEGRSKP